MGNRTLTRSQGRYVFACILVSLTLAGLTLYALYGPIAYDGYGLAAGDIVAAGLFFAGWILFSSLFTIGIHRMPHRRRERIAKPKGLILAFVLALLPAAIGFLIAVCRFSEKAHGCTHY